MTHYSDDIYITDDYVKRVIPEATESDACWIVDNLDMDAITDAAIKKTWKNLLKLAKEAEAKRAEELANATGGFVL